MANDLVSVLFKQNNSPWQAGEQAGFKPKIAAALVSAGKAVYASAEGKPLSSAAAKAKLTEDSGGILSEPDKTEPEDTGTETGGSSKKKASKKKKRKGLFRGT